MDADDPAGLGAVFAGLAPEVRRVRLVFHREVVVQQDLVGVHVRHRHLRRRTQPEIVVVVRLVVAAADTVGVLAELRELAGATHRLAGDRNRREQIRVPLFAVDVQHELDQGVFQSGARTLREVEPAAGDLRPALEVEDVQFLAQIVVWDNVVGHRPEAVEPLATAFDVVRLVVPRRHRLVGDLWQPEQPGLQLGFQLLCAVLDFGESILQFL